MSKEMTRSQILQERLDKINKLADYAIMGILFFLTSAPLITMGASVSALYKTIYDYKVEEKPKFFKIYWTAFLNSFKQSTIVWSAYLTVILAFILNRQSFFENYSLLNDAIQIFLLIMIVLITPVVIFMLFYIGRFYDRLPIIFKNTVLILMLNLLHAIKILIGFIFIGICIWLIQIVAIILPTFFIAKVIKSNEQIFSQFQVAEETL